MVNEESQSPGKVGVGESLIREMAKNWFDWPYLFLGAVLFLVVIGLPAWLAHQAGFSAVGAGFAALVVAVFVTAGWEFSTNRHGKSRWLVFGGWALAAFVVGILDLFSVFGS
jgi:hypothetical protein